MADAPVKPAELPPGLGRDVGPPAELKNAIRNKEALSPCGVTVTVNWTSGPWKGLPMDLRCHEPNCLINGGECTAPRFVPLPQQYTSDDPDPRKRRRRRWTAEEAVAGIEQATKRATKITGVRDTRSPKERARYAGEVLRRMRGEFETGGFGV